jgi:NAD(P) transhydrogenase subunit alpha
VSLLAAGGFDAIDGVVVFVLATLLGFEVITKVPSQLHTPLMSGSNAISGVVLLGAILLAGLADGGVALALGLGAVVLATINVVGGFVVTDRMLRMFRGRRVSARRGDPP